MTCLTCRWGATVDDREGLVCIRFPPGYDLQQKHGTWTGFPMIRPDWLCGEYAADPLEDVETRHKVRPSGRPGAPDDVRSTDG